MSSSLHKHLMKSLPKTNRSGHGILGRNRDYTPEGWDKYYTEKEDVKISEGNISFSGRVYRAGTCGPLLVLLHGGGYSGLTWALMVADIVQRVDCRALAIDLRGHGSTVTLDDEDLSATTLSNDVRGVIEEMFSDEIPPIILVGHSMGGAIAVHVAHRRLIPLLGLVVIDVVEGTALDALQSMQCFLKGRPASFTSIENAIEWCVRSGQVRNMESAKVSMPGQIKSVETNHLASVDVSESLSWEKDAARLTPRESFGISEEEEEEDGDGKMRAEQSNGSSEFKVPTIPPTTETEVYTWRIDLSKTEKYWHGWFRGLSDKFLECAPAKMLLLAGIDRLDKSLTIGQMQGKFQCVVLPQCGHAVHEDVPEKVAEVLASYMVRNKFVQPTGEFEM